MRERLLLLFLWSWLTAGALAYTQLCRCECGSNYTVLPLQLEGVDLSCNNCTKKYCAEHASSICSSIDDASIGTSCFQRESVFDQFVVYGFVVVTGVLLAYALVTKYVLNRRR